MAIDKFDLIDLVRSLQRESGHQDCFRREQACCDQLSCPWRDLCLPEPGETAKKQDQSTGK